MDVEKPESGLLQTCRELGIAIVAYSPLGRRMLTGQYKSIDDFDENDLSQVDTAVLQGELSEESPACRHAETNC